MNEERIRKYIQIWLKNIKIENQEELEKNIEMSLEDFIINLISNIYDYYKVVINNVTTNADPYSNYIIKPIDGKYSLEDFLLNRLLRCISSIKCKYGPEKLWHRSLYNPHSGNVIINFTEKCELYERRNILAHELLHGIKSQFYDVSYFEYKHYYAIKEELKKYFPDEINDFSEEDIMKVYKKPWNFSYKHCGIRYSPEIEKQDPYLSKFDRTDLDEIFNEVDSIKHLNDDNKVFWQISDELVMVIRNPGGTNSFITNYAYILDELISKKTRFIALYLEPLALFEKMNAMYSDVFRSSYEDDRTCAEILVAALAEIKSDPHNIEKHIKLLNTLYDCLNVRFSIRKHNKASRENSVKAFVYNGILKREDGSIKTIKDLKYNEEFKRIVIKNERANKKDVTH